MTTCREGPIIEHDEQELNCPYCGEKWYEPVSRDYGTMWWYVNDNATICPNCGRGLLDSRIP